MFYIIYKVYFKKKSKAVTFFNQALRISCAKKTHKLYVYIKT